jgi:hypothetical protein
MVEEMKDPSAKAYLRPCVVKGSERAIAEEVR